MHRYPQSPALTSQNLSLGHASSRELETKHGRSHLNATLRQLGGQRPVSKRPTQGLALGAYPIAGRSSPNTTQEAIGNDPSAGSPTETLLRLLLPRSISPWRTFQATCTALRPSRAQSELLEETLTR